jgi:hypothetical protein
MGPRKYRRLINPSVSVSQHQPIGIDDETQSPNRETQDSPTPITGLDAQSSPTAHDLHGWPSQSTLSTIHLPIHSQAWVEKPPPKGTLLRSTWLNIILHGICLHWMHCSCFLSCKKLIGNLISAIDFANTRPTALNDLP